MKNRSTGSRDGITAKALKKQRRAICIIVTLVVFVAALYFIGKVIFPNLGAAIREIADAVQQSYPKWIATLDSYGINTEFMQKYFPEINSANIIAAIRDGGLKLLTTAGEAATSVFSTMTNMLFGIIFALYILASKKKLGRQAKQILYAYLRKSWAERYAASHPCPTGLFQISCRGSALKQLSLEQCFSWYC